MAERRMFAKSVVDSDLFLDMPLSTQALYFHLGMRADDDGFINNPRKIQKMCGASADDLKLLFAKKFIYPFDSGIVVILHWKTHNYIPKDRYKPTLFQDERNQLLMDNGLYTPCIQSVDSSETQVRIGKDRLNNTMSGKPDCSPSFCKEVVDFLNQTAGKSYRSNCKKTVKFIEARRKEGFTLEDFKKVITIKTAQWRGTNMDGYLRPETLFGTKFEGYLQDAESRHQQEPPRQTDIDWDLVGYGPEEVSG